MRILFAGKQHFDPGGIPASTDQLMRRLQATGHTVATFAHTAFDGEAWPAAERLLVREEQGFPYPAWSVDELAPSAGLELVLRRFAPEVVVVSAGGEWWHDWTTELVEACPATVPVVLYVRDTGAFEVLPALVQRLDGVLANAQAHVDRARSLGVEARMVPSVIELDQYRVEPTGEAVVFINPVAIKGVETAFAIAAARPDLPFHFRESWNLPRATFAEVARRAAALGNVEVLRSTTVLGDPYRAARLLLVPYEDLCRPRVVPEAQISGIPILGRGDPALRECIGPGGVLVAPDAPLQAWLDGLDSLWGDPVAHARYSAAALDHARRPEIDPARIALQVADELAAVVRRWSTTPPRPRTPVLTAGPVATVVVPVYNVGPTIDAQLEALAAQTFRGPWEIVVADNGCTDDTLTRLERWRPCLPPVRVVDAKATRGVAHARNVGLRAARGDLLLICDGDDRVEPGWLAAMAAALEEHPLVTGRIELTTLNRAEQYAWTGDADRRAVPVGYSHLPYAAGGNLGMWRTVFEEVGTFDESLRRAEDIDFSWRAHELGIGVHYVDDAVLHVRMRETARAVFRSALRGGLAEPGLYRRHGRHGMPRAGWDEVRREWRWLVRRVPAVIRGEADRQQWAHWAGKRVGRVVGSLRNRTQFL